MGEGEEEGREGKMRKDIISYRNISYRIVSCLVKSFVSFHVMPYHGVVGRLLCSIHDSRIHHTFRLSLLVTSYPQLRMEITVKVEIK